MISMVNKFSFLGLGDVRCPFCMCCPFILESIFNISDFSNVINV